MILAIHASLDETGPDWLGGSCAVIATGEMEALSFVEHFAHECLAPRRLHFFRAAPKVERFKDFERDEVRYKAYVRIAVHKTQSGGELISEEFPVPVVYGYGGIPLKAVDG